MYNWFCLINSDNMINYTDSLYKRVMLCVLNDKYKYPIQCSEPLYWLCNMVGLPVMFKNNEGIIEVVYVNDHPSLHNVTPVSQKEKEIVDFLIKSVLTYTNQIYNCDDDDTI